MEILCSGTSGWRGSEANNSSSLGLALGFLGRRVRVEIDRPMGSAHPEHGFVYEANYGYIPGVPAPDGDDLDAYYLGVHHPLTRAEGDCVAVIHRPQDNDDKLIVVPPSSVPLSDEEIEAAVRFQEKFFAHVIVRGHGNS